MVKILLYLEDVRMEQQVISRYD